MHAEAGGFCWLQAVVLFSDEGRMRVLSSWEARSESADGMEASRWVSMDAWTLPCTIMYTAPSKTGLLFYGVGITLQLTTRCGNSGAMDTPVEVMLSCHNQEDLDEGLAKL